MRISWLLVAASLAGCAKDVCEINYRGCCLVEKPNNITLAGDHCWPGSYFIFNAGLFTHMIDEGKKGIPANGSAMPTLIIRTDVQTPEQRTY